MYKRLKFFTIWQIIFLFAFFYPSKTFSDSDAHYVDVSYQIYEIVKTFDRISMKTFEQLKKRGPLAFRDHVKPEHVYRVDGALFHKAMKILIENQWNSMDLFANPIFCKHPEILYYDKKILAKFFNHYTMDSLFPGSGKMLRPIQYHEKVIPRETPFEMEAFLVGDCRNVIFYAHPIIVHRTEPLLDFLTGNYQFYRNNFMEIASTDFKSLKLENFLGRNAPHEPLKPVHGPLGARIKRFEMTRQNAKLRAYTNVGWWTVKGNPFQKNKLMKNSIF